MAENIPDLIRRFRGVNAAECHEFVANRLRGKTESPAELHWRALFVTALAEAKLWPHSHRDDPMRT